MEMRQVRSGKTRHGKQEFRDKYYIKELTVGWRHGLSLRAPAKQVRSCEFKPKYRKQNNPPTKKKKNPHYINEWLD
jgi:hypothetical protein